MNFTTNDGYLFSSNWNEWLIGYDVSKFSIRKYLLPSASIWKPVQQMLKICLWSMCDVFNLQFTNLLPLKGIIVQAAMLDNSKIAKYLCNVKFLSFINVRNVDHRINLSNHPSYQNLSLIFLTFSQIFFSFWIFQSLICFK